MPKIASAQVSASFQQSPDQASRDPVLRPAPVQPVSTRDNPANDDGARDNPPSCLVVTTEEVRVLHRYLSREILDLFN